MSVWTVFVVRIASLFLYLHAGSTTYPPTTTGAAEGDALLIDAALINAYKSAYTISARMSL